MVNLKNSTLPFKSKNAEMNLFYKNKKKFRALINQVMIFFYRIVALFIFLLESS